VIEDCVQCHKLEFVSHTSRGSLNLVDSERDPTESLRMVVVVENALVAHGAENSIPEPATLSDAPYDVDDLARLSAVLSRVDQGADQIFH
jgi:hypothetical protein